MSPLKARAVANGGLMFTIFKTNCDLYFVFELFFIQLLFFSVENESLGDAMCGNSNLSLFFFLVGFV